MSSLLFYQILSVTSCWPEQASILSTIQELRVLLLKSSYPTFCWTLDRFHSIVPIKKCAVLAANQRTNQKMFLQWRIFPKRLRKSALQFKNHRITTRTQINNFDCLF